MLQDELQALEVAIRNFCQAVRRELLKLLGVDKEVRAAFMEGWQMHSETDPLLCKKISKLSKSTLDILTEETRVWRSKEEAWANSDSEELFSEPVKIRT